MVSVKELRDNQDTATLKKLLYEVQQEDEALQIPDRDDLYTDKVLQNASEPRWFSLNGEQAHPLYAKLVNMLSDGLSPNVIVVGKERLGKSMATLEIARKLHSMNVLRGEFIPAEQIHYDVIEYLTFYLESTRRASVCEEANESLNSNQYNSAFNSAVASTLRTQGKRENLDLFTCPDLDKIDPRIEGKCDMVIELVGKRKAKVTSYAKKHGKRSNRGLDYHFYEYPFWNVPKVSGSLRKEYERIDNQYKGDYLRRLLIKLVNERMQDIEEEKTAVV